MTPKQADNLIRIGKPVLLRHTPTGDQGTILIIRRDRWNLYGSNGEVVDRKDLEVVSE